MTAASSTSASNTLTIARPDDWHLHLRDGAMLALLVPHSARQFARAIVMPNLQPPVTTTAQASAYRDRIRAALPAGTEFEPLMTLYLTERTSADEIARAKDSGVIHGVKLYPAGATTHSESGVTAIGQCDPALAAMQRHDLPLLVHGEVTQPEVDVFDRERVFIEQVLIPLRARYPDLRVVFEHVTTADAVDYVRAADGRIAATITAHHLLFNRNSLFVTERGRTGLRPHYYCLPVLKREAHRRALLDAVASGNPRYFLGTDSAPHPRREKESACGCAGCFTATSAIEMYATAFEEAGALDKLEGFASFHGADFYGLPRNRARIALARREWTVPEQLPWVDANGAAGALVPLAAGSTLRWQMVA